MLQSWTDFSEGDPEQDCPLQLGAGLLQSLFLVRVSVGDTEPSFLHSAEQLVTFVHDSHDPHPPFTENNFILHFHISN